MFASEAMRVFGLAYRDYQEMPDWDELDSGCLNSDGGKAFSSECKLTLLSIIGIEDPLRDNVPSSIATCYKAGIDVRMVTGDDLDTASATSFLISVV